MVYTSFAPVSTATKEDLLQKKWLFENSKGHSHWAQGFQYILFPYDLRRRKMLTVLCRCYAGLSSRHSWVRSETASRTRTTLGSRGSRLCSASARTALRGSPTSTLFSCVQNSQLCNSLFSLNLRFCSLYASLSGYDLPDKSLRISSLLFLITESPLTKACAWSLTPRRLDRRPPHSPSSERDGDRLQQHSALRVIFVSRQSTIGVYPNRLHPARTARTASALIDVCDPPPRLIINDRIPSYTISAR